jgi:hypothetical protein
MPPENPEPDPESTPVPEPAPAPTTAPEPIPAPPSTPAPGEDLEKLIDRKLEALKDALKPPPTAPAPEVKKDDRPKRKLNRWQRLFLG